MTTMMMAPTLLQKYFNGQIEYFSASACDSSRDRTGSLILHPFFLFLVSSFPPHPPPIPTHTPVRYKVKS